MEKVKGPLGELICWDCGGKDKIRALWRHYYPGCKGIVFCVDCNDHGSQRTAASCVGPHIFCLLRQQQPHQTQTQRKKRICRVVSQRCTKTQNITGWCVFFVFVALLSVRCVAALSAAG